MSNEQDLEGLPIESLIAAPLEGAVKANGMLADATAEYFERVAYERKGARRGETRMVEFEYDTPVVDEDSGKTKTERVEVKIPLIAVAPAPTLKVQSIDVEFDVEVRSMITESDESNVSSGARIFAKTTSHRDHARNSDTASRYQIKVRAESQPVSEVFSRVLDLMSAAVVPQASQRQESR